MQNHENSYNNDLNTSVIELNRLVKAKHNVEETRNDLINRLLEKFKEKKEADIISSIVSHPNISSATIRVLIASI